MLQEHISTAQWLTLPLETRTRLVEIFDIPKSAYTVVEDNTVTSDGYMTEDLFAITKEKCQTYLDRASEEDTLLSVFGMVIKSIEKVSEPEEDEVPELGDYEELAEETTELEGSGEIKGDGEIINAKVEVKKSNAKRTKKTQ